MNNLFPLYADLRRAVDPRIVWTRATGGTLRGPSGFWREMPAGCPLLHHPSPGRANPQALGVLMGQALTNVLPNPRTPGGAGWTTNGLAGVTEVVGPDGNTSVLSGRRLTEDTATSTHGITATGVNIPAGNWAFPMFLRGGTARYAQLMPSSNGFGLRALNFDTELGVVTATTAALLSVEISREAGGWWRVAPLWPSGGGSNSGVAVYTLDSPTQARAGAHLGAGRTLDVAWPMAVQDAALPSVILPATTGASTRAADGGVLLLRDWSLPTAETGTLLVAFRTPAGAPAAAQPIAAISDGTANNRVVITRETSRLIRAEAFVGGVSQGSVTSVGTVADDADAVTAVRFGSTELALFLNGAAPVTATPSGSPTGLTQTDLLAHGGTTARVGFRPRAALALTNADLQSITRQGPIA